MNDDDIELKVSLRCDAPLPNDRRRITFYNKEYMEICDDCIRFK